MSRINDRTVAEVAEAANAGVGQLMRDLAADLRDARRMLDLAVGFAVPIKGQETPAVISRKAIGWRITNLPHVRQRGGLGLDYRVLVSYGSAEAAFEALFHDGSVDTERMLAKSTER